MANKLLEEYIRFAIAHEKDGFDSIRANKKQGEKLKLRRKKAKANDTRQ